MENKVDPKHMRCVQALIDSVPDDYGTAEAIYAVETLSDLLIKGVTLGLSMNDMKSGFREVVAKMRADAIEESTR